MCHKFKKNNKIEKMLENNHVFLISEAVHKNLTQHEGVQLVILNRIKIKYK